MPCRREAFKFLCLRAAVRRCPVDGSQRQALKSPAIDPFCGNARAAATHTIQPRHGKEIYGTARKSFSRAARSRISRFQAPPRDFLLIGEPRISAYISRATKSPTTESRTRKSTSQRNPDSQTGDTTMIKTALTAALVLGSVSFALASEFDPNLGNRYPQATQSFQTRNVALRSSHRHQQRAGLVRSRVAQLRRRLLRLACYAGRTCGRRTASHPGSSPGQAFARKCTELPRTGFPPPVLLQNSRRPPAPAVLYFLVARVCKRIAHDCKAHCRARRALIRRNNAAPAVAKYQP